MLCWSEKVLIKFHLLSNKHKASPMIILEYSETVFAFKVTHQTFNSFWATLIVASDGWETKSTKCCQNLSHILVSTILLIHLTCVLKFKMAYL